MLNAQRNAPGACPERMATPMQTLERRGTGQATVRHTTTDRAYPFQHSRSAPQPEYSPTVPYCTSGCLPSRPSRSVGVDLHSVLTQLGVAVFARAPSRALHDIIFDARG